MELAYPSYYHWDPIERFYPDVVRIPNVTQRAIYRSPWPVSSFCLVADGVADVELDLTARLPQAGRREQAGEGGQERVTVAVNGRPVGTLAAGERWAREVFRVAGSALTAGLNKVTLHWPVVVADGEAALAQVIDRLEQGIAADLHPVFGEVFSLRAQPR
jgi:antitoxin (DNA-binding transcriptional repressor) of toxin-antitoxin stability system